MNKSKIKLVNITKSLWEKSYCCKRCKMTTKNNSLKRNKTKRKQFVKTWLLAISLLNAKMYKILT